MKTELTIQKKQIQPKTALLFLFLFLCFHGANAQGAIDLSGKQGQIEKIVQTAFDIISLLVGGAGLILMGKAIMEGIKGEQGSWTKLAGVVAVVCLWFFVIPPLADWMFDQSGFSIRVNP